MKYYKITNEDENHNGLQYHDGLNIDLNEFQYEGSCVKGGIYFASKDIFAFLYCGVWIREVTIPEGAKFVKDIGNGPIKYRADRVILGPRRRINEDVIIELIEEGANIHTENDYVLRWASKYEYLNIIRILLECGADIHTENDYALRCAAYNGNLEFVKLLLKYGANIHVEDHYALRSAIKNGYSEVVKVLLEY